MGFPHFASLFNSHASGEGCIRRSQLSFSLHSQGVVSLTPRQSPSSSIIALNIGNALGGTGCGHFPPQISVPTAGHRAAARSEPEPSSQEVVVVA